MQESIYDKELLNLKELKWLPWIGKEYADLSSENKVLFIGESHYLDARSDSRKKYESKYATIDIVNWLAVKANESKSKFFVNTHNLIFGIGKLKKEDNKKFWSKIVFYNFIQEPMKNKKGRPTNEQRANARANFLELIKILKPSVCLFLGVEAEKGLNALLKPEFEIIQEIHTNSKINGCWGRYGKLKLSDDHIIKLVFVRHPSTYFDPTSWNKYLLKYIPYQMAWFKSLIAAK